jgi:Uri superfamily endonuclease
MTAETVKGVYVLIIKLKKNTLVTVGKLGTTGFAKGLYAYVGSAQIALEKRIERHLRREKRVFWHIDYLLQDPDAEIVKIFYQKAAKSAECNIAERIADQGKAVVGFGCSDCRCKSHLFRVEGYDFLREFMQEYLVLNPSTAS